MMTINIFNRLTGQETLHPLVGLADLSGDNLDSDICKTCNFYALLCNEDRLRLVIPGETLKIPSAKNKRVSDIPVCFFIRIFYAHKILE